MRVQRMREMMSRFAEDDRCLGSESTFPGLFRSVSIMLGMRNHAHDLDNVKQKDNSKIVKRMWNLVGDRLMDDVERKLVSAGTRTTSLLRQTTYQLHVPMP